jgi:acetoin utilization deacetylase AcuC-like enzyme
MPKSNLTAIGLNPIQGLHFNTSNIYHPEHPNRIDVILKRLESSGILKECQIIQVRILT